MPRVMLALGGTCVLCGHECGYTCDTCGRLFPIDHTIADEEAALSGAIKRRNDHERLHVAVAFRRHIRSRTDW